MKKTLKYLAIFIFAFVTYSLTAQYATAQNQPQVEYTVSEPDKNTLRVDIRFPEPAFRIAKRWNTDYFELHLGDCYPATDQGKPNLPLWNKLIEIPAGATFEISTIASDYQTITIPDQFFGMELVPVQPPQPKSDSQPVPWMKDTGVYQSNTWFGYALAAVEGVGTMRNTQIGRLSVSPVEYHSGNRTLRYTSSVSVVITFTSQPGFDATVFGASFASPYLQPSGYTLNGIQTTPPPDAQPVHYLILSDPLFQQTLQPFVEWKTMKGFKVTEVYKGAPGVGTTASSMKSYLAGIYNGAGPSTYAAPSFLLIVGDVQQIPAFNGTTGGHVTDLYYAEYTNDLYPELLYGRFSATTLAHLEAQIEKTLHHEKFMMLQPGYLDHNLLVAGADATFSPIWANGQMHYIEDTYMHPGSGLTAHTFLYPASSGQTSQIIQKINEGVSIVNYSAHGGSSGWADPAFTSTAVNALTNTGRYPTIISNACETNTFGLNQCFGETLLRVQNKGAIGHIGASANTFWDEDYHFAVGTGPILLHPTYVQTGLGFYDRLFHTHGEPYTEWAVTQGGIINAGNIAVTQAGSFVDYYWEIYHLMGDPSLMPYLGVPAAMTPQFAHTLPTGLTQLSFQTDPYAYVAVSANGVLHGAGHTNANGVVTFNIDPFNQPTTAKVVITGQNLQPYFDSILFISPNGPYVLADSVAYRDMNGNFNNLTDAGETIQMDLRMKNFTGFPAGDVNATLRITDPYITITDSLLLISSIQGLSSSMQNNAFSFIIDDFVPDQYLVSGIIMIEDSASNSWITPVNFVINSARISIRNVTVSDQAGNGNGKIEPGENFDFIVNVTNKGNSELYQVNVSLSQNSSYVQLLASQGTIPVFMPGQTYAVSFAAVASASPIPKGSFVRISTQSAKNYYIDSMETFVMLDLLKEDFETNNFTSFPWTFSGPEPWFVTTAAPYEGTTCVRSGAILAQSSTSMSLQLPVIARDSISFFYKVSSEASYDFLRFSINQMELGRWSGEQMTWKRVAFVVDTGLQTFTWSYEKDYYWEEGADCAWVDYIVFPVTSICIGVNNPQPSAFSFNLYPNPTTGNLLISIHGDRPSKGIISILNANGQQILQQAFSGDSPEHSVSLSHLSQGIYFVLIETDNHHQIRKLIKL